MAGLKMGVAENILNVPLRLNRIKFERLRERLARPMSSLIGWLYA
jgi:hypothetical protein